MDEKKQKKGVVATTLTSPLFWMQFVIAATFASSYWVVDRTMQGRIDSPWLAELSTQGLRRLSALGIDVKFRLRGPRPPKQKVVIVGIDSESLAQVGRWPWHRDQFAALTQSILDAGAKVIGFDIVFSEPDGRISPEIRDALARHAPGLKPEQFETDPLLERVIAENPDRIVLGWMTENTCRPRWEGDNCPVLDERAAENFSEYFSHFALPNFNYPPNMAFDRTSVMSFIYPVANIPSYERVARRAGYLNAPLDSDGTIRRSPLFMISQKRAYPSLALAMAMAGRGEDLRVELDEEGLVREAKWEKSGVRVPVTRQGTLEANFKGGGGTYTTISAVDILRAMQPAEPEAPAPEGEPSRALASEAAATPAPAEGAVAEGAAADVPMLTPEQVRESLKDAYVLIGLTAVGWHDLKSFPFGNYIPGTEGWATFLDNLLADDWLIPGFGGVGSTLMILLMTLGALALGLVAQRLEAIPAIGLFLATLAAAGLVDTQILFRNQLNWDTSFLVAELMVILVCTVAMKYVFEERNKKFVQGAMGKYVSPAVVAGIMEDPTKLTLGGEKRELTIMFSDIRSFTTFSERMDAKALSQFLNDYLTIMSEIVKKHDGTLDKYIGDAVMAFWGAPLDQPSHATNAAKAAIEMQQALAQNRPRYLAQYGIQVDIGVGLNTGVVTVGNMGGKDNFSYTVIGDHVNLASRMEGLTKPYASGIVTSRFTFDSMVAAGHVPPPHRVLDFVKVKGKKQAVELIQLLEREYGASASKGLEIFQQGRAAYVAQKWDDAAALFHQANALIAEEHKEDDGPSLMYLERIDELRAAAPGEGWDGSWEMKSK